MKDLTIALDNKSFEEENQLNLKVTWTAPFTLDVPNNYPDITYCVDISSLTSVCGIIVTDYGYRFPLGIACVKTYDLSVTPVNMPGNGSRLTVNLDDALNIVCFSK